jgi:hypothetical protein
MGRSKKKYSEPVLYFHLLYIVLVFTGKKDGFFVIFLKR